MNTIFYFKNIIFIQTSSYGFLKNHTECYVVKKCLFIGERNFIYKGKK